MLYHFEGFSLDAKRRELRRGTALVALEPQVLDVLLHLIDHRDRVVEKDDLMRAVWGSRIVSDSTLTSRITLARQAVGDSGGAQRLIRTLPHKGYRFVAEVEASEPQPPPREEGAAASPAKVGTSIAVLPFTNLIRDADGQHFVEGLVEDVTNGLARFPWLRVAARTSSAGYSGRVVDIRQIGGELGVRYVLEGSVRAAAGRVRIAVQLVDAETGACLHSDRFDGKLDDSLDLQDRIASAILGALASKIEETEIERALIKASANPDAYDLYLRGIASVQLWTRAGMDEALRLFQQAILIDPRFAAAYGMAAYCYVQRQSYGWLDDRSEDIAVCAALARRAADLGRDDAAVLANAAHALSAVVGEVEVGATLVERALLLNPNAPRAWYASGWIDLFLGNHDRALDRLAQAAALSPFDPLAFKVHGAMGYAHLMAERYDEGARASEIALHARPVYLTALRGAAANYALAGRLPEARERMSRIRQIDPRLRTSMLDGLLPFRVAAQRDRWVEGLRRAGLPD